MIIFANNFFRLLCWKIAIKNGVKINKFYGPAGEIFQERCADIRAKV